MIKHYDLDRLEGRVAVLVDDDGRALTIAAAKLPKDAREGDRLNFDGKTFTRDVRAAKAALAESKKLLETITKR